MARIRRAGNRARAYHLALEADRILVDVIMNGEITRARGHDATLELANVHANVARALMAVSER